MSRYEETTKENFHRCLRTNERYLNTGCMTTYDNMETIKISELTGSALDWAVAKCLNITPIAVKKKYSEGYMLYSLPASTIPLEYSSKWSQGGPIIERERITIDSDLTIWCASSDSNQSAMCYGPTPLIAAMRCYVASKMGDAVEIPEELI
jgi:Protein of unknown function (DUF2591)